MRAVGSLMYTTGKVWMGPQGGKWAEIDVQRSPSESGWVLVEGPGFGVTGPLLVDEEQGDDGSSQMINIRYPAQDKMLFSAMMPKKATIDQLVRTFCARTGLNPKETVLTKGLPKKAPNGSGQLLPLDFTAASDVLVKEMTIKSASITGELNLVYMGHFEED